MVTVKPVSRYQEVDMLFSWTIVPAYNTYKVVWLNLMANKEQSYTVKSLLRGMETTQRASQSGHLTIASIAGVENSMAGVAYRSFGKNRVPDTFFLSHFLPAYLYRSKNIG